MTSSQPLVLLGVALAVWACTAVLRRAAIPTAVVLVVAGVAVGFLPFVPDATLNPHLALDGFLPPLVFYAAYWTSPRSILDDRLQIGLLAVGLVGVTAGAVAGAAHSIAGLSWPMSFVLGTAVGPTDAVAVTSIATKIGLPQRLSTLMQSEGMFNDATALVLYAAAVTAATTGRFSAGRATISIGYAALIGAAIGLAVAFIGERLRRRIDDPPMVIVLTVLIAYGSYFSAETLRASGVIAGVTAGMYLGWHQPSSVSAQTRLQSRGFWDTAVFLLEATLFILLGLSLHAFTTTATSGPVDRLLLAGLGVVVVVITVRLIWTSVMSAASQRVRRLSRPVHSRREHVLLGWSGMRGGVTLAAVLAIPMTTTTGLPLPGREDVIYLAFAVIFATLVGQGLTLPLLARRLRFGVEPDDMDKDRQAPAEILRSAHQHFDHTATAGTPPPEIIATDRDVGNARSRRVQATPANPPATDPLTAGMAQQRELIAAQRRRLVELRGHGGVTASTFRAIQHNLDLDEERLLSEATILDRSEHH